MSLVGIPIKEKTVYINPANVVSVETMANSGNTRIKLTDGQAIESKTPLAKVVSDINAGLQGIS